MTLYDLYHILFWISSFSLFLGQKSDDRCGVFEKYNTQSVTAWVCVARGSTKLLTLPNYSVFLLREESFVPQKQQQAAKR